MPFSRWRPHSVSSLHPVDHRRFSGGSASAGAHRNFQRTSSFPERQTVKLPDQPPPVEPPGRTRVEQAEARTEQAETRTEQAKTRTEFAETRTEQAETRTEQAKTRTEQAETRTEAAEAALARTIHKEIALHQDHVEHFKQRFPEAGNSQKNPLDQLTSRQREILKFIAEGQNTKQIAEILNVSPKTVEYHRMKLMAGLNLHDIPGLVRYALRVGLISPEQ
jgi:DNA-binding CsgD family transcriptional regulator